MHSTSPPPPPPPYASKHTIIAAPPAVSNRSAVVSPLPTARVSTGLNITFSTPPSPDHLPSSPPYHHQQQQQPRRHLDHRFPTSPSYLNAPTISPSSQNPPPPPQVSPNSTGSGNSPDWKPGTCSECQSRITNLATACQALGCFYHNQCFKCFCCQRTLCGKTFYKDQDKIYCEEDYLYCGFQRMAEKCTVCGHIITEKILMAMGKTYHPGCFRCCICNACMDGEGFTVDSEGRIFCLHDYYLVTAPTCAACVNLILPDSPSGEVLRVVAMNKEFHIDCYRCEDCNMRLSDEASSRCYPYVEPTADGSPGRTHLLCLKCHLSRIGATLAPGQNIDSLLQQRRTPTPTGGLSRTRRGSNGSAASSFSSPYEPGRVYSPTPGSLASNRSVVSPTSRNTPWRGYLNSGGPGDGR